MFDNTAAYCFCHQRGLWPLDLPATSRDEARVRLLEANSPIVDCVLFCAIYHMLTAFDG